MPNELPAFLQEFIKHRQHTKKETPHDAKHTGLTPASKTKDLDTTIKGIIEKKPTLPKPKTPFAGRSRLKIAKC